MLELFQGGVDATDLTVAAAVVDSDSQTRVASAGVSLPLNQTSPVTVTHVQGTTETTFHSRGITLRGPVQDDSAENLLDQGARLTIHSSHGARNSNYGEGLRMVVDTERSKNMIAWYDNFSEPGRIKLKAWIGYHHGTWPDVVHDHISIETPKANGALHTRFGISTAPSDVTNIDVVNADFQHSASQGGAFRLAVGGSMQTTHPRDLIFATGIDHSFTARRWALRADTAAESGGNKGSDLRIMRYADSGDALPGTTLAITRDRGHLGIGVEPHASWRVNIESGDRAALRLATNASSGTGLLRIEGASSVGAAFDSRVAGDAHSRFSTDLSGRIEWGDGAAARDTNLRRTLVAGAGALATSSDLYFDTIGKGPILRTPDGTLRRVRVNNDGSLYTTAV